MNALTAAVIIAVDAAVEILDVIMIAAITETVFMNADVIADADI